jgi:hypothetical protein
MRSAEKRGLQLPQSRLKKPKEIPASVLAAPLLFGGTENQWSAMYSQNHELTGWLTANYSVLDTAKCQPTKEL